MTTRRLVKQIALAAASVLVISVPASAFSVPAHNLALRSSRVDFCSTPTFRAPSQSSSFSELRCVPVTAERTEEESITAERTEEGSEAEAVNAEPERWLKKDQCGTTIQRRALGLQKDSALLYLNQFSRQADMDTLESRKRRPDDFGDELGENSDDQPAFKQEVARLRKRERLANMWKAFQTSAPMQSMGRVTKSMGRATGRIGSRFSGKGDADKGKM